LSEDVLLMLANTLSVRRLSSSFVKVCSV